MPQFVSNNKALQNIANSIMNEHELEVYKILVTKILYQEITGIELKEITYESGCKCMGDYCNSVLLHGIRMDKMTIKDIEAKYATK